MRRMGRKASWPPRLVRHHTGRARVTWRGKDYWPGAYGSPEAQAAYEALLERLARQEAQEDARRQAARAGPLGLSIAQAVLLWQEGAAASKSPQQRRAYARALTVLVRVCGHEPAAAFSAGHLDRVRAAMLDGSWLLPQERGRHGFGHGPSPRGGGPWAPRHAARMAGLVRTAWRWLELRGHAPPGSWAALKALPPLRSARPRRREWSDAEVGQVALACRRSPARLMLLLQLWTGARSGEVRAARWDEVDLHAGLWRPSAHKNAWRGHDRIIAVGPRARLVLAEARRRWPPDERREGADPALVFPCPRARRGRPAPGGMFTAAAYAWTVRRAARRAGLAGLKPYDARHLARMRVSRAAGLEAARSFLGHATATTTAQYGQAQDVKLAQEAARLAG
jgi:integrase